VQDAFDKWLASGRPAYVSRSGPSPAAIVDAIHDAGGIASMAHPGVTARDELIGPLAEHGLDAIEVYHSDHTLEVQRHYQWIAMRRGLLVTGGSDFHGEEPSLAPARATRGTLGLVSLPPDAFDALERSAFARSQARRTAADEA
jgi:3',5'-nucleoside bisphosphate phosphatase